MEIGKLWVSLGLDKKEYDRGVDDVRGSGGGLGSFIKNAFSFTVGQGMFDMLKTGVKSAWDMGIGFNASMEQTQASFETMLGSADKAKSMISDLSSFAASTPFEMGDLNKSAETLLGFGIEAKNVMPYMKMLGDVSQGNKDKFNGLTLAFSQIQSAGKMTGQDLMQMINNGFNPLQTMSQLTGKSMATLKDEMSKGAISADMVTQAFQAATSEGGLFYGAMDKQSKTFNGQMSTLADGVKSTVAGVVEPIFTNISTNILPKVIDAVGLFADTFKATGSILESVAVTFDSVFGKKAGDAVMFVGDTVSNVFGFIKANSNTLMAVVVALTSAFVAYKIAVLASTVTSEIHNAILLAQAISTGGLAAGQTALTATQGSATVAQWALNAAMTANPIGIIIVLVAALVGAVVWLWNTNEGFRNALISAWNTIKAGATELWRAITTMASNIGNAIVNGINSAIGFIANLPASMRQWGRNMIQGLIDGIGDMIASVGNAVSNVTNKVKDFLGFNSPSKEGEGRNITIWGRNMVRGFVDGIDIGTPELDSTLDTLIKNPSKGLGGITSSITNTDGHLTGVGNSETEKLLGGGGTIVLQTILNDRVIAEAIANASDLVNGKRQNLYNRGVTL